MMHRILMLVPAYRRMHAETAALTIEVSMLRTTLDFARQATCNAYDTAYDRRVALRAIAACETEGANGTVKKMARIASDALKASTLSGDLARDYQKKRAARAAEMKGASIEISSMDGDTKFVQVRT